MPSFSSLVLFANDLDATVAFYRALGLGLENESHGDGPQHAAIELGEIHFAIYQAEPSPPTIAARWRSAATVFPGWYVDSLDAARAAVGAIDAEVLVEHQQRDHCDS